ncbi:MAG: DUF3426 domain-containing protein, partial [Dechloromonas sp.]|nr:DUF3426 domain-containing protein [Dechloromonas sp.]
KAGKVRCGQCQHVFNAFDYLLPDASTDAALVKPPAASTNRAVAEPVPAIPPAVPPTAQSAAPAPAPAPAPTLAAVSGPDTPLTAPTDAEAPAITNETLEQSTEAARAAGLVAARTWNETSGYNRWASGPLAADGTAHFDQDHAHASHWPFVLAAASLCLFLLIQTTWHFRTQIVMRLPASAAWYAALAVDVPLPRESELVSIESSDLQSDNARGLFVLNALLKNRAAYAQAWPALELTLTDVNDRVVSRRVIHATDYLPTNASSAFPGQNETLIKLWVEARNIGAAGYRLYIFYP